MRAPLGEEIGMAGSRAKPSRRAVLAAAVAGGLLPLRVQADDGAANLVRQMIGRTASESDRVRISMPRVFPNGSAVPFSLAVDSPMTERDYVKSVRLLAPKNPIIEIGAFHFTPRHGVARVTTRIRLAEPQHVVAVAEMSDGTLLMNAAWVEVETNGCT
jgi:sulfur-oxidizing protein SoxY